ARFNGPIHAGEIKSFPVIDGIGDPEKMGQALDQVSVYILLARQLVEELRGNPDSVSATALLITPTNVGLQPTISVQNVSSRLQRADSILRGIPRAQDVVDAIPAQMSFGAVADKGRPPGERIEALDRMADRIGTTYRPECLSTCANARFCRQRAAANSD